MKILKWLPPYMPGPAGTSYIGYSVSCESGPIGPAIHKSHIRSCRIVIVELPLDVGCWDLFAELKNVFHKLRRRLPIEILPPGVTPV